nr:MAG TPA: hypothetical protein [Caudoviricetes sp.]
MPLSKKTTQQKAEKSIIFPSPKVKFLLTRKFR